MARASGKSSQPPVGVSVALDAMGGDFGPPHTVPAALAALVADSSLSLTLIGQAAAIEAVLKTADATRALKKRLTIHDIEGVVGMDEPPTQALRRRRGTSLHAGLELLRDGKVKALVSAGNTGALMAVSRHLLGTLPGIDRPAICSRLPSSSGQPLMLDLGANPDCTPEQLVQFARMGAALAVVSGIEATPRGAAEHRHRGHQGQCAGPRHLAAAGPAAGAGTGAGGSFTYTGYIEADAIYRGEADVIVCDGFTGNVSLKTGEGAARLFRDMLKATFLEAGMAGKLAALAAGPVLSRFAARLDPARYNGASLLGLAGTVVKSHGGASVEGLTRAIQVASAEARADLPARIAARGRGVSP